MTTNWQGISNKCKFCGEKVGDFKLKPREYGEDKLGKNVIEGKKYDNFGTFSKVKGKSIMEVICRKCQKKQ